MILFRAYIVNKAVTNRVYWAGSEDAEVVKLKKQITDVFTSETFPFAVTMWGVDEGSANVLTIHQCSCEADYKDSSKIQNSLLIDKDFMRYIYNLDTKVKTIEIFYKPEQVIPVVALGEGITVYRISDMANASFALQNTQAIYAQGTNDNIWAWAKSLKSDIVMPISKNKKLNADDSYKFQFNSAKELTSVSLFSHLERYQVYGEGNSLYTEYTADFADELTNLGDTEIVLPKFDNHGNRIAQTQDKANFKEYVKVPKDDGSGGYDKVLLKDL